MHIITQMGVSAIKKRKQEKEGVTVNVKLQ